MNLSSPRAVFRLVRATLVPSRRRHRWDYVESDRVFDLVWSTYRCVLCGELVRIPDFFDAYEEWEEMSRRAGECYGRVGEVVPGTVPGGDGREVVGVRNGYVDGSVRDQ